MNHSGYQETGFHPHFLVSDGWQATEILVFSLHFSFLFILCLQKFLCVLSSEHPSLCYQVVKLWFGQSFSGLNHSAENSFMSPPKPLIIYVDFQLSVKSACSSVCQLRAQITQNKKVLCPLPQNRELCLGQVTFWEDTFDKLSVPLSLT